jgi:DNA adenine methylase
MMRYISPLRYPGGKAKLGPYFARIIADQSARIRTYAEPYAGGAGAGLYLLVAGQIDRLLINDLNPGIAAFWRSSLGQTSAFVESIEKSDVSLDAWHYHRSVYLSPEGRSDLELGFSTFFMNRCNRSGILTARPIGGLDQLGKWKIDARFNRSNLARRVRLLGNLASKISVTQKPALEFLSSVVRRRNPVLLYVDPPYLGKGDDLYMSDNSWSDQEQLAVSLKRIRHPWILTYDFDPHIRTIYPATRCLEYSISHTAQKQRVGQEFMLFSDGLQVEDMAVAAGRRGTWVA